LVDENRDNEEKTLVKRVFSYFEFSAKIKNNLKEGE